MKTRLERQRETRRSLLAAAERAFMEDGFDSASLDSIAGDAGFTRGAFYTNFESKSDLLMSVAEEAYEQHIELIEQADPGAPVHQWFRVFPRRGPWFHLSIEAWGHARRNAEARKRLAAQIVRLQTAMARFLERAAEKHGTVLPMHSQELAAALIALRVGLLIQRTISPDSVPPGVFVRVAATLLGMMSPHEDERRSKSSKEEGEV